MVVIPCGKEDGANSEDDKPFEIKIRKKGKLPTPPSIKIISTLFIYIANENSLKEIFLRKPNFWEKIFK